MPQTWTNRDGTAWARLDHARRGYNTRLQRISKDMAAKTLACAALPRQQRFEKTCMRRPIRHALQRMQLSSPGRPRGAMQAHCCLPMAGCPSSMCRCHATSQDPRMQHAALHDTHIDRAHMHAYASGLAALPCMQSVGQAIPPGLQQKVACQAAQGCTVWAQPEAAAYCPRNTRRSTHAGTLATG